jgi:hypothetical protein
MDCLKNKIYTNLINYFELKDTNFEKLKGHCYFFHRRDEYPMQTCMSMNHSTSHNLE